MLLYDTRNVVTYRGWLIGQSRYIFHFHPDRVVAYQSGAETVARDQMALFPYPSSVLDQILNHALKGLLISERVVFPSEPVFENLTRSAG